MEKNKVEEVIKLLDKAVVMDTDIYDMKNLTPFYDYSIICSVSNSRQGNAAVSYLLKEAPAFGFNVRTFHAMPDTKWFLVDLGSIVVHIFVGDERDRYNLDGMYNMQKFNKIK